MFNSSNRSRLAAGWLLLLVLLAFSLMAPMAVLADGSGDLPNQDPDSGTTTGDDGGMTDAELAALLLALADAATP